MTGGVSVGVSYERFIQLAMDQFFNRNGCLIRRCRISVSATMVIYAFLLLFGILATSSPACACPDVYDISDYGAVGDGVTDNSEAFLEAWKDACSANIEQATLTVPKGETFLVNQIVFRGPCRANAINFQILGDIVAPSLPTAWKGLDASQWIAFYNVERLHVNGHGMVDGRGASWWNQSCKWNPKLVNCTRLAPTAMKFLSCNDSSLSELYFVNSSQAHISILDSHNFHVSNMIIEAPESSPNTDGIHIHRSRYITINNAWIGTGDDCVSIQDQTSNIQVSRVYCGPGHGISIGSLGKSGNYVQVENILVRNVKFRGTTNGARIKTWQVAKGYVRNVVFQNLSFDRVKNPIIIDQNYCDKQRNCTELKTGVHISNVVYNSVRGTSSSQIAVNLNCSRSVACTGLYMKSVFLSSAIPGKSVSSSCTNAYGWADDRVEPQPCLV